MARVSRSPVRITNDKNEPLPGVNIIDKKSGKGTITDSKGAFKLNVSDKDAVFVLSMVGYQPQEFAAGALNNKLIRLSPENKTLEDVVVIGYGTVKKSDLTGSVVSVSAKDFKGQPVTGVGQALQGHASGVQVVQASNAPGGGVSIRIRGGNSINAGNEPLYVIDGFPLYNESGSNLNPNDIESIEVLKDASATAIYGSRGANGVVMITTKRGKAGRNRIEFDAYYGVQRVQNEIPMLNATEYALLVNEAQVNAGRPVVFTDEQIAGFGKGTNWQKEIFRPAPVQNYQLNFQGGNERTRFALIGSYFKQEGVILESSYDRASLRLNLDHKINDRLTIGTNLNLVRNNNKSTPTDGDGGNSGTVVYGALNFSPTQPVYNPDGSPVVFNTPGRIQIGSPFAQAKGTDDKRTGIRLIGNGFAEYRIGKGLSFRTSFGADLNYNKQRFYISRLTNSGAQAGGQGTITNRQTETWLNENTLTYNQIFGMHNLTALAGYSMQASRFEFVQAGAQNFTNDILGYENLGGAATILIPGSSASEWRLNSYIGRVQYGFNSRYLATVTVRADGSSRFGEGNKWAVFPSGSVAWRVSEENFMLGAKAISDLKLRASYGVSGNQEIGEYQAMAVLATQNYSLNSALASGVGPARVANPNLKWESTSQFDLGIDLGLWNNRLMVTADYYQKKTTDLLLSVPMPFTSGFSSSLQNLGSVNNTGVELGITSKNFEGKFRWTTSFNIAFNRNEVLDLGGQKEFIAGEASGHLQLPSSGIVRVGEPVGVFYGYIADGIFQDQGEVDKSAQKSAKPGDRRYVDQNSDGVINGSDRVILGQAQPKVFGGLTNTFNYKNFELSVFLQGVSGNSILNINRFELESLTGVSNQSRETLNRWTPTNHSNTIPRANAAGNPYAISSRQVENGSYLRVKNITFAYNLPSAVVRKIRAESIRLYVSAQNYITWTKYSGFDPEVSRFGQSTLSQGIDYGSYPGSKTIIGGISIAF